MQRLILTILPLAFYCLAAQDLSAQAPANDNFADRILLSGAAPITTPGTCVGATAEPGEPDHAADSDGNAASNSVWWSWTAQQSGSVSFAITNSFFDNVISVYTGTTLLGLNEVSFSDRVAPNAQGQQPAEDAVLVAQAGVTYSIAIDGYSAAPGITQNTGTFELVVTELAAPANDDFVNARVLLSNLPVTDLEGTTEGATAEPGEPNHANLQFDNVTTNSVWYCWTAPSDETVFVSVYGDLDSVFAVYTGTLAAGLFEVAAADSLGVGGVETASFTAAAGTTYWIAVDAYAFFPVQERGNPFGIAISSLPANDPFAARQDLGNEFPVLGVPGSVVGATPQGGEPEHGNLVSGNLASGSVWYTWMAPAAALVGVDVDGPLLDSVVSVYTGDTINGLTEVVSVDRWGVGIPERPVFQAVAGTQYVIAVDNFTTDVSRTAATQGLFELNIYEVPPNDDFVDATDLFDLALPLVRQGTTLNASSEFAANEPNHGFELTGNFSSNSVWYLWMATEDGAVEAELRDLEFDGVLAVYSGTTLATLAPIAAADAFDLGGAETLTFQATAGVSYVIAVDAWSFDGQTESAGTFTLELSGASGGSAFDTWIAGFPSLSGADAERDGNPSGDGVSNLLKLVLGLDPTLRLGVDPNRGNYPRLRTFNGNPALEYVVDPVNLGSGGGAIQHRGQLSGDLSGWTNAGALNLGGNTWVIEIQTAGAEARYGRLIASDPAQ